jgi:hypothetical protein
MKKIEEFLVQSEDTIEFYRAGRKTNYYFEKRNETIFTKMSPYLQ